MRYRANGMMGLLARTALCGSLAIGVGFTAALAQDETDRSQHDMSTMSPGMDMSGSDMSHEDHDMSPELMAELRAKVPSYKNASDQQIMLSMSMMGQDYPYYVSDKSLKGDIGLLVLTHGFREAGDKKFAETVGEMSGVFPTAIGYGMAMMGSSHIQTAIDELEAAGAKTIVVVPAVSTIHSELWRQYQYIFGNMDEAAYASVPRVTSNAKLLLTDSPEDDPLIAEIVLDHALEMSSDPANEVVIVVAHGPTGVEENEAALGVLSRIATPVKDGGGFADVKSITLQDDAPKPIRDANVATLRAWVQEANDAGHKVIIATNLMAARSIQAKIRKDLDGLDYVFNSKGITEHPNFVKWLGQTVRQKIES